MFTEAHTSLIEANSVMKMWKNNAICFNYNYSYFMSDVKVLFELCPQFLNFVITGKVFRNPVSFSREGLMHILNRKQL